jgi:DNA-binding MarR family transcriptional regulator
MQLQTLSASVYEAICSMHRRNRTVASAYDTSLSPMAATVLPEIEANPGISIVELQSRLHLDQVSTTRLIEGLVKEDLVTRIRSKVDKRRREIRLTRHGKNVFGVSSARAFATFKGAFERLPEKERKHFLELFQLFNDGLGAHTAAELPIDPPGMTEIRRISRVLGVLGRSMFGIAECSPLEWHIFDLLSAPGASSFVVELAELIGSQPKTTAALVQRLAAQGLVKQAISARDKRFRTVTLTSNGRALHARRRALAEKFVSQGLQAIPEKDVQRFVTLLRVYTGVDLPSAGTIVASSVLFRHVADTSTYPDLRSFIYQHRVLQGLTRTESAGILGDSAVVYGIWSHDVLVAVASFVPAQRKGIWRIEHLIWDANDKNVAVKRTCVLKLIDQFVSNNECAVLRAPTSEVSADLRDVLPDIVSAVFEYTAVND